MTLTWRKTTIAFAFLLATQLPISAQEREWVLDAQDKDTFIVFGVPNTTDMGLSLWCKIGEKSISLFAPMPRNIKSKAAKVALKLDDVEFPLHPKFSREEGNETVEAELKPRDKIMTALKSSDRIGLHIANHTTVFPTEGANFSEFSRLCEASAVSN
jgi:hypothetical protein